MEVVRRLGFAVAARSDQGPVRRRNEDAYTVLLDATAAEGPCHVLAVFDGLGGHRRGDRASQAAADHLPQAARTGPDGVLGALNGHVMASRGFTTAVVAFWQEDADGVRIASVGDSAAYVLEGGRTRLVVPKDATGPTTLTDYLGHDGMTGHVTDIRLPVPAALLLCTDGVDGVVGEAALRDALVAEDPATALTSLFEAIAQRGMPDNATAVLVRRLV